MVDLDHIHSLQKEYLGDKKPINKTEPLVSVWVVAYQHINYISECLDSILMQDTDFPYEIVLGEDQSTDGTRDLCIKYAEKHTDKIRLFLRDRKQTALYDEKGAFFKSINGILTLKSCRGKYIALCDGDDYWTDPYKLQKQIDFLESHPDYSICFHESLDIWEDCRSRLHNQIPYDTSFTIKDLAYKNFISTGSCVFRNNLTNGIPEWFADLLAGDWALHFLNAQFGDIYYMKDCMSVYRIHIKGFWSRFSHDQMVVQGIKIMMNIDKGTNYKYHQDLMDGIQQKYKTGNPEEINNIIADNKQFKDELSKYLKSPDEQQNNILNSLDLNKQLTATINDPFLNPSFSIENLDLYLVRLNILNFIKNMLPELKGILLDLGCGKLPYKQYILSHSKVEKYIGLDIENPTYQQNSKPDLFWDGEYVPLKNNSVDCVMATELFEHVPDIDKLLNEIQRVLKPCGLLFFTVPFLWPLHDAPNDEYRYTPFALERHMKASGFADVSIKALGGWNASLAQMIGLWLNRSGLMKEQKNFFAKDLFNFYNYLIQNDVIPQTFQDQVMPTGFSGTALKNADLPVNKLNNKERSINPKPNKIVIIEAGFPTVSETFILDQMTGLIDRGGQIENWAIFNTGTKTVHEDIKKYDLLKKTRYMTIPPEALKKDPQQWLQYFMQKNNIQDLNDIHAFHVHFGENFNLFEPIFRLSNKFVLVSFHGYDASKYFLQRGDNCYDFLFKRADLITTPSYFMKNELVKRGCDPNKVIIHRYGIDLNRFICKKRFFNKNKITFLTIGRFVEKKGIEYSLKAFAKIHKDLNTEYKIIGEGQLQDQLLQIVNKERLKEKVKFLGAKTKDEVIKEMRNADVFILTSVVAKDGDSEGVPVSLTEAHAMGLPVVSTYHSGIPELVIHEKTGLLSRERDVEDIARNMLKIASDINLRKRFSKNAVERVNDEFDIEKLNDRLFSILHESSHSTKNLESQNISVSVIMAAHNAASHLSEAIQSILQQTHQDFELIIVDDASTDETVKILEHYTDPRIKIIKNLENIGPAGSRNKALNVATGKYIAIMDADDISLPNRFATQVKYLERNPDVAMVGSSFYQIDEKDQKKQLIRVLTDSSILKDELLNQNWFGHSTVIIRREIMTQFGGYDEAYRYSHDYDLFLKISEKYKIANLEEPLCCWRSTPQAISASKAVEQRYYADLAVNAAKKRRKQIMPKADQPLVSVIVPTYNRPEMLKEAIGSILAQSYQNFEIVVINDNGVDVESIISDLNNGINKILYIKHPKNKGLAAARNTGIMASRGSYIAYLDDDDIYYPDHLETLVNVLKNGEYEIAYTDANRAHQIYKNGEYLIIDRDVPYSIDFSREKLLYQNISPVNCFMHTRKCLEKAGLFDEDFHAHEDWELWVRLSREYDFIHIKKITTEFRWRADGSTMSSNSRREFLRTMEEIFERNKIYAHGKHEIIQNQATALNQLKRIVDQEKNSFKCSIIIPLFNKIDFTKQCLEALIENTPDDLYEVIIVDNGSTDGTKDFISTLEGDVKVIANNKNLGFAKACNQGANVAAGEYLVFLNNDTIPHKNWLTELVDVADAWKDVGIVGSRLLFPDNTIQHAGVAMLPALSHMYPKMPADFLPANKPRDLNAVTAACMLVRRDFFFSVGCFHEGYINGCEDIDLCMSVREAAKRVFYNPRSMLTHFEGQTPGREDKMDDNRKILFERWKDKMPMDYERYLSDDGFRKSPTDKTKWDYHEDQCKKTVSIIIVTYNSLHDIKRCLSSIQACTNLPYEVFVIDNNSTDGTRDYLKGIKGVHVIINDENIGFAKACNQGIQAANGEYIVLLNPDTEVTTDWAWRTILHFRDGVGAVGPVSNYVAGIQKYELYRKEDPGKADNNEISDRFYEWNKNQSVGTKLLVGFCMMVKRTVMDDIGMLDEDFFLGIEDLEYSWRLRQKGYKLAVATDVFIYHQGQKSFSTILPEKNRRITQDCQDKLYDKLEAFYGKGRVPSSMELWGMDWFQPSQITKPKITSIIILCFNQIEYTKRCLRSIEKYTSVPYELILVDNASTDGTGEFLKEYENKHPGCNVILNKENRGFAGGNNQGIAAAKGDYILLLNNDVIVTQDWLERLIAHIESDSNIGMVGPVSNSVSGPQLVENTGYGNNLNKMHQFAQDYSKKNTGRTQDILRLVGFCLLTKRQVIDIIDGLDESYGNGNYEDDDLCLRSNIAGFRNIVAHDVFIHHYGSMTFKGNAIDYWATMQGNRKIFADKWKGIVEIVPDGYRTRLTRDQQFKKLIEWGEERFSQGNIHSAVKIFERVLKMDRTNSQALNNLGVIQWQLGDIVSAMKTFQTALILNPKDADALGNLAQAAKETARFDLINPGLLDKLRHTLRENPDLFTLINTLQNEARIT